MSETAVWAWYLHRDGQTLGPYSTDQISALQKQGALRETDYIWDPARQDWQLNANQLDSTPPLAPKLQRILYTPIKPFVGPIIAMLSDPARFARERIDIKSSDTVRAVGYFLRMYFAVFVVYTLLFYLTYRDPSSQARQVSITAFQLVIAILVVYAGNAALRQPVRIAGVTQAIVYADALFIVTQVIVAAPLLYAVFTIVGGRGDIDVLETEYRTCLADTSWIYFLTRGPTATYVHADYSPLATALDQVGSYIGYLIVLPFCYLVGRMLNARYSASTLANCFFVFVAYAAAVEGGAFALRSLDEYVHRNSDCLKRIAPVVARKYGRAMVAEQVSTRLASLFAKDTTMPPRVYVRSDTVVVSLSAWAPMLIDPKLVVQREDAQEMLVAVKQIYCSDWWVVEAAREVDVGIEFRVDAEGGANMFTAQVRPVDCATPSVQ